MLRAARRGGRRRGRPACAATGSTPRAPPTLALGGEACPTCREPLFFARGAREAAAALAALAAAEAGGDAGDDAGGGAGDGAGRLDIGDVVRVADDAARCARAQAASPAMGAWHATDMGRDCGTRGVIVNLVDEDGQRAAWTSDGEKAGDGGGARGRIVAARVRHNAEVAFGGANTWTWSLALLTLVRERDDAAAPPPGAGTFGQPGAGAGAGSVGGPTEIGTRPVRAVRATRT